MRRNKIHFIFDRGSKSIKHHCVTRFLVFARSSFLNELHENEDIRRVKSINFFFLSVSSNASCTMGTGSFPGVRCCQGVTLTPHPLLVQRSKME
jgi:hypothetical protein